MLLKDKVIVITGVGPGMGSKLATIAAAEGAKVAISARSEAFLKEVADEITSHGGKVISVPTDVGDLAQCERLVQQTVKAFGRIDGLVNSAYRVGAFKTFEDASIEEWQSNMDITCFGALRMSNAVLPERPLRQVGAVVVRRLAFAGSGRRETGGGLHSRTPTQTYGMNTYCTVAIMVGTAQTMDE